MAPLFFTILVLVLVPKTAFGWAPATHLFYVKEVVQYSYLLEPSLRELLTEYLPDFLYGCIAADITIGKAYVEYLYNCHNFDVGLGLLRHTRNPAEKAFVYGYLSHLAADTVSHNFFVPYQNIEHFQFTSFRHAYWEVRLDQFFGGEVWHEVEEVVKNPRTRTHDKLLDGALKDTIFSFKTNRVLFGSMIAIQRLKKWQTFVKSINRLSKYQFNAHHLAEYNRLAVTAIIRFLNEAEKSPVYKVDPTGLKVIEESQEIRKMLRNAKKHGHFTEKMHKEECERFRSHIRKMYFTDYVIEDKRFHPSIHAKFS